MANANCPPEQEPWRSLQVGDGLRLVRMPSEFSQPGYTLQPETREQYLRLITSRRRLRVYEIDESGLPWVRYRWRGEDGLWVTTYLAFDHDGWVRIKRRVKRVERP